MAAYATAGNRSTAARTGATVSRHLRAAGFNVSPAARRYSNAGLTVSGTGGRATILVDLGGAARNDRVACDIIDELMTWGRVEDGGIDFEVVDGAVFIWVDLA